MQLKEIEALKNAAIRVGSVFKMVFYPKDGITPKGESAVDRTKYFVIAGIDSEGNYIGAAIINTDINLNFAHEIAPYQHCIYPDKYAFLNGKYRYVDCYKLREIEKQRIANKAEYIDCLDVDDIDKIRMLLKSSPTTDPCTIEQYNL